MSAKPSRKRIAAIDLAAGPIAAEQRPAFDPKPQSIRTLTSLRFFAALYVLLLHSGSQFVESHVPLAGAYLGYFLKNGYLGVSLFFVLSGFILTYVYESSVNSAKAAWSYSLARFARIYPVYLLSLLIAVFTIPFFPQIDIGPRWPQFLLLHSWMPLGAGFRVALWNSPAWTLSVELAFYILFPFAVSRIANLTVMTNVVLGAVLAGIIIFFRTPSVGALPSLYAWMDQLPLPLWRIPEFLIGCVVATLYRAQLIGHRNARILTILTLSGLLVTLSVSASAWVAGVAGVWFALLIYSCASSNDGAIHRLLSNGFLVFMGGASYAIYIFQSPIRALLEAYVSPYSGVLARAIYYPLLLSFSAAVYHFYEEPVRRGIRRMLNPQPWQDRQIP